MKSITYLIAATLCFTGGMLLDNRLNYSWVAEYTETLDLVTIGLEQCINRLDQAELMMNKAITQNAEEALATEDCIHKLKICAGGKL